MNKKIVIILIEIIILLIFIALANSNLTQYAPEFIFYENTGLQCPTCGGTRCVLNILQGNFKNAFFIHPIIFITIFYLLVLNIVFIINFKSKKLRLKFLYPKPWYAIIWALIICAFGLIRNLI